MPNVIELETINHIEREFYLGLPYSLRSEFRSLYCERMQKSVRSFQHRLKSVPFSAPEQQIFKEFADKYNVVLYATPYTKENQSEKSAEKGG